MNYFGISFRIQRRASTGDALLLVRSHDACVSKPRQRNLQNVQVPVLPAHTPAHSRPTRMKQSTLKLKRQRQSPDTPQTEHNTHDATKHFVFEQCPGSYLEVLWPFSENGEPASVLRTRLITTRAACRRASMCWPLQ